jgi:hypothetical protein
MILGLAGKLENVYDQWHSMAEIICLSGDLREE